MMATALQPNPAGKIVGWGCAIFFVLFWSSFTLGFDVIWGRGAVGQIRAVDYPTVVGLVAKSELEAHHGKGGPSYSPKITYTYRVDGRNYTGDRYRYGQWNGDSATARRIVDDHPAGRQVDVHYSPADPADSVLLAGLEGSDLFLPMFLTPFNLVMLALWCAPLASRRRQDSRVAKAKILDDGFETRVRLVDFGPVAAGLVVAGALAFLGCFVVAIGFGANPQLPVMYVAWGVIASGGALACLSRQRKIAGGRFDLVIDGTGHHLTLPQTQGRKESVAVDVKQIAGIEVEKFTRRGSKGSTYSVYVPTLVIAESGSSGRREKLVEWSDEARANELADWLRQRLRIGAADPRTGPPSSSFM